MKNTYCILLASGDSSRFGSNIPKPYITLKNQTLIDISITKFYTLSNAKIICVINSKHQNYFEQFCTQKHLIYTIVHGGKERFNSVQNALNTLQGNINPDDIILIHDIARPLTSTSLIHTIAAQTPQKGCIIPVIKTSDTIKEVKNNQVIKTLDRSILYNTQTPQGFTFSTLQKAYSNITNLNPTDDSSLLEHLNLPINTIDGEYTNIKITTPTDYIIAQHLYDSIT